MQWALDLPLYNTDPVIKPMNGKLQFEQKIYNLNAAWDRANV